MTDARFFRNSTKFFSNSNNAISFTFSRALVGQGFCRFDQKNPTHGFRVSTKSRPKFAKKQILNFHISPKWGQFAPTLDNFYQILKAVTCKCQFSGVNPLRGQAAAILAKNVRRRGSSGQTGSRNMAATRFLDFYLDFLFDPRYIRGSISHRYGSTPRSGYHYAVVKASGNAKIF